MQELEKLSRSYVRVQGRQDLQRRHTFQQCDVKSHLFYSVKLVYGIKSQAHAAL